MNVIRIVRNILGMPAKHSGARVRGGHVRRKRAGPTLESLEERTLMTATAEIAPEWFAFDDSSDGGIPTTQSGRAPAEWIVQLSPTQVRTMDQAAAVFARAPRSVELVGGLGQVGQVLVRADSRSSRPLERWFNRTPSIENFGPNALFTIQQTPNDPNFSRLWGLHNSGQSGGTLDVDIDAPEAWDGTTGSSGVVVAVIDTGVDYRHPDLDGNMWRNPGERPGNGIDDDRNGFVDDVFGYDFANNDSDPMDDDSHGTHVAGTIAAEGNNGIGVVGVNWQSSIMALKFLTPSGGETADAVRAINYATMMRTRYGVNVRVTNNSWGSRFCPGTPFQPIVDAIAQSGAAGILFVAAAGNHGCNTDLRPVYPASYDLANIVSVASIDRNGRYASSSNYGARTVDLAAPGVDVLSTVPGGGYGTKSGTSMASPHVAGVASLAWAINPNASVAEVKAAILNGTVRLTDTRKTTVTNGLLNAYNTLQIIAGPTFPPSGGAGVGVFRPQGGLFYLDVNARGYEGEQPFQFGLPGDRPIAGDWNGDGITEAGVYRNGQFFLDTGPRGYQGELPFQFGLPGDWPIAGDWNGDGIDEVGVYRNGQFFLDAGARGYQNEQPFQFGLPGDLPIAGDWNGDGIDEVGVYRNGQFFLDTGPRGYQGELPFQFGLAGDLPVAGDWNDDGISDVGVFRGNVGLFYLDIGPRGFQNERPFQFGLATDLPVAGNWTRA